LTKPAKAEVSSGTSPAQEDNAAKKALTAADKAAVASKVAAAASAKALEASQQASKAAKEARSAAHTNPGTNSSNDANSVANGSANQQAASPHLPQVHPPEAPALITSNTKSADEQARLRVERTIGKLQGAIAHLDSGKLTYDGKQRYALGTELLKGAQKAFLEHDYAAADSLATKASVLLAPLGVEAPGPAGH
jgi:hypothetical protein